MREVAENLERAVAHLTELAEGWECGAKMEDAIVAAYQPELDSFNDRTAKDEAHDMRLIRAVLDARSNRDRFRKDAESLRTVLAALAVDDAEKRSQP